MQTLWQKISANKFSRFILSSGTGFFVDIISFYFLYRNVFTEDLYDILWFNIGRHSLVLAVSFFLGVLVNFLMTRFIVFTESTLSPYKQFVRFAMVAIIGFFANLAILHVMIRVLDMYAPLARIIAALSLFFASFFIHKFFSFNLKKGNGDKGNHIKSR